MNQRHIWAPMLILSFGLALACGKANDDTTPAKTPASPTPRAAMPTPAATAPATPAAAKPTPAANTAAALPDGASLDPDRRTHMTTVRTALVAKLGPTYNAPIPKADAKAGGELFAQNCVVCHGDGGKGDGPQAQMFNPPPADLTNMVEATFYSDAAQMEIIKGGVTGSAMPAWEGKMTNDEILQVFNYIRSLRNASAAK